MQDFVAYSIIAYMIKSTLKTLAVCIRNLRINAGLSQTDLAEKLGIARQSVGQIESGTRDVNSVELAHIAKLFDVSVDSLLNQEEPKKPRPKFFGKLNIVFNAEKLQNTLLYVLSRCGGKPNVGETVLYKLLYFIDFDSFETRSETVTGLQYIKYPFGPVPLPRLYLPVIRGMEEQGVLKIVKQIYHDMAQKKYVALADPDLDAFSGAEMKLINNVIDRLSDMTATQIKTYVHDDAPWLHTEAEEIIDYRLVFERTEPFARSDREAMWQEAGGADSLKGLGRLSKGEADYYQAL